VLIADRWNAVFPMSEEEIECVIVGLENHGH
jgi:hypothetical protein